MSTKPKIRRRKGLLLAASKETIGKDHQKSFPKQCPQEQQNWRSFKLRVYAYSLRDLSRREVRRELRQRLTESQALVDWSHEIQERSTWWCWPFAVVLQSLSHVRFFVTQWTVAYEASLSFALFRSLLKLMSIELMMPSNSLNLYHSPSPPAFNLSLYQVLFQWVSSSHEVAKVLDLQLHYQAFQWIFRIDLIEDWLVWSPFCPRDFQEPSSLRFLLI